MAPQFIYTMKGLGKVHQPDHVVLKDIWLSFLPGAKIGVLGLNGSGKSTLLRIMAGEDKQLHRRGVPGRGHHGRLPAAGAAARSRRRRSSATSRKASPRSRRSSNRYDEINAKFGEELSPEEMDKVLEEQGKVQDRIEAANGWDLDSRLELAMDALRLPPPDADVTHALGRRAAPRGAVPAAAEARRTCCCSTSRPTTSTPSRSPGSSASSRTTRAPSSRSRTIATSSTTSPAGSSSSIAARHPLGGQLLVVARAEAEPARAGREGGDQAAAHARSASSTGSGCRRARGRPRARRASTRTRTC